MLAMMRKNMPTMPSGPNMQGNQAPTQFLQGSYMQGMHQNFGQPTMSANQPQASVNANSHACTILMPALVQNTIGQGAMGQTNSINNVGPSMFLQIGYAPEANTQMNMVNSNKQIQTDRATKTEEGSDETPYIVATVEHYEEDRQVVNRYFN